MANYLKLSAADINMIIDALQYAFEQTETSAGEVQVFCRDSELTLTNEENLGMANEAKAIGDRLYDLFKNGGFDVVLTEEK